MVEDLHSIGPLDKAGHALRELAPQTRVAVESLGREMGLGDGSVADLLAAYLPICHWLAARCAAKADLAEPSPRARPSCQILGVSGAQGTGKSTFRRFVSLLLSHLFGWRVCGFSIDDLYLTRQEREELARQVHPLFRTRGAPGTHDVGLGCELLDRLRQAVDSSRIAIPRFDKDVDDRAPQATWPVHHGAVDLVIFEGWCVGLEPQGLAALEPPINRLEAAEDPDGTWRRRVDELLGTDYAALFSRLDRLIYLRAPGFEQARQWRRLQERKLRNRPTGLVGETDQSMDDGALERFLMCYERLSRHGLATLSEHADVLCELGADHRIQRVLARPE